MWVAWLAAPALCLPVGQSYATRIDIPLLGAQTVSLSVLNETHARVSLRGLLSTEGFVSYTHTPVHGFDFKLDDALQTVVRKYGCSLSHADFDFATDEARLTLHIRPLFLKKRLRLRRSQLEACSTLPETPECSTWFGVFE